MIDFDHLDIKQMSVKELENLASLLRENIIDTVSKNGGHLSSNLGVVELIIGMHYVFEVNKDPFIFDVSHQSYPHKLLNKKHDIFHTLRQFGGLSGYTKPDEGDYFVAGHSSTSISLAVGACKAIQLKNEDRVPVVLIGDGALSAGMAYEALNELGDREYPCIIILNDNEMSISKPIGAISKYLSQAMATQFYQKFKKRVEDILEYFPQGASYVAKRFEEGLRLITPGILFEELGLEYIGPINGHNISEIITALNQAKSMKKPCVVHAQTVKGKGYQIAEGKNAKWHGVSAFDINSGKSIKQTINKKSATEIFSNILLRLAQKYENIVGVTAAMPSGTGLDKLIESFPHRFWDVAIAEQHAVTSMAAMAKEGFKPFIVIYSTFMQRAYDQVIHDCAIMNLNVVIAMDRAGIVGEDGETHQGAFDISFLSAVPNITIAAPRDEGMMEKIMEYAYFHQGVFAFRYPRGNFILDKEFKSCQVNLAKAQILIDNQSDKAFLGFGQGVGRAKLVLNELGEKYASLIDLIFVKPLDEEFLKKLAKKTTTWFVFSDSVKIGGVASLIMEFIQRENLNHIKVISFEYEDKFITHGRTSVVEASLGLDINSLCQKIKSY
ncbi:1-deoxy-D-xylulose-5-phosphate synthase [Campylobacter insulaenigrae]|uniref:1-deoxy-D-xylulose-5-phosphate synthase n=1 Tax=Campylobacter insulaenigrae NCTC 12927 TaxID=1031564 RepID=A0A0A8H5Q9_9BACT|nr:1-deoxy-D-xylulose-5-phosphate synthase [Campylobacter insulaenigrae]AJC88259.1 1-deoxyxylulose-5-phosphate synthase [Campylobacter insulaenigrae NCTC 12927]MCR6591769.1 1-deoxy-D-xylulose-5-phosphate synthase [Campylobacter insulaenigrae]MCR6593261.1 1-deoxy-D-xylulose-5-phosphate synthase [Campylobacter insulaenigrae]VEH95488.1 1-deoxy-D-xylulose-5-phosphate synthase [Campylobacter insulaenigrae]VEJ55177.1 1-deoxy-D-xylulose-5-phosphate synthase [Campylobacter insulaenigrae]